MGKHTKGEWRATVIGNRIYIVSGEREIAVVCVAPSAGKLLKPIEMEANAQLLAAAPPLLEACKEALGIFEEIYINSGYVVDSFTAQPLRAAIAAAEPVSEPKTELNRIKEVFDGRAKP
jgi:hypothetical protein